MGGLCTVNLNDDADFQQFSAILQRLTTAFTDDWQRLKITHRFNAVSRKRPPFRIGEGAVTRGRLNARLAVESPAVLPMLEESRQIVIATVWNIHFAEQFRYVVFRLRRIHREIGGNHGHLHFVV